MLLDKMVISRAVKALAQRTLIQVSASEQDSLNTIIKKLMHGARELSGEIA